MVKKQNRTSQTRNEKKKEAKIRRIKKQTKNLEVKRTHRNCKFGVSLKIIGGMYFNSFRKRILSIY